MKKVYRHPTKIFDIIDSEGIKQQQIIKKCAQILIKVNEKIRNEEDKLKPPNKGDMSSIVSGRRWIIEEITARKILMSINALRKRKDKYELYEVFEEERVKLQKEL